jgi:hypothetical protein
MTQTGRVRCQFDHPDFLTFLLRAAAMQKRRSEKDQINAFTFSWTCGRLFEGSLNIQRLFQNYSASAIICVVSSFFQRVRKYGSADS